MCLPDPGNTVIVKVDTGAAPGKKP